MIKKNDNSTKNKIIDAVARLITTEGIDSVSMKKVAKLAGLSVAAAYSHFKNKEDMLRQTYLSRRQHYNDFMNAHVSKSGTARVRLVSYMRNIYNFGQLYPEDLILIDTVVNSPLRRQFFSTGTEPPALTDQWLKIADDGKRDAEFQALDSWGILFLAFHVIVDYIKDVKYGNIASDRLSIDEVIDVIMHGIIKH
ncbi:MAG: TetR/AcrR family transcriptional regulator [Limosilactobacillus sp.]